MPLTSTTRYLDAPFGLSVFPGEIASLRNKISSRKRLYPIDIDSIRDLYNLWIAHTHTYYDEIYVKYANSPNIPASSHADRTSSTVTSAPSDTTAVVGNYLTFLNQVSELISNFNSYVYSHRHTVTDTWDSE